MLAFALGLGLAGALVMVIVTIPATREGRGPWTWWARKRAERARRLATRPAPTAEERFARGLSLVRFVGAVRHALPRRRRRREASFVQVDPRGSVHVSAQERVAAQAQRAAQNAAQRRRAADGTDAVGADSADSGAPVTPARPLREKVDERTYVAQVEAQADMTNEIVIMVKKRIPTPEVIEADPIDADIVNPRILSRSN